MSWRARCKTDIPIYITQFQNYFQSHPLATFLYTSGSFENCSGSGPAAAAGDLLEMHILTPNTDYPNQ